MNSKLMNAATNAAIGLASMMVRRYEPDSREVMALWEAWAVVREALVAQAPDAEREGLRMDLDELFDNTRAHAQAFVRRNARRIARKG